MDTANLFDIPPELLVLAFRQLDIPDLRAVTEVCRYFKTLSEPYLYRDIIIRRGRQAAVLSRSFRGNTRRVHWVRSLLVSTKYGDDEEGLHSLPPWIARMHNLRDIRLETPDCNAKLPTERISWITLQDRYERVFGQASILLPASQRCLPNLRNCTVHLVDETREMYTLKRHNALFLHPNLRSLTISCASTDFVHNLPEVLTSESSLTRSTRLEHLHLEECDIDAHSLLKLLRLSQNLKSLKISEGIRYDVNIFRQGRLHGNIAPDAIVEAMNKYCSKSLTDLSLALGYFRHSGQSITQRGQHLNLTLFDNLKRLSLDLRTCALIRVNAFCDHATYRRLPPSLESLTVFGIPLSPRTRPFRALDTAYLPFNTCLVKEKQKHGLPNLNLLTYSYEYGDIDENASVASSDASSETVEQIPQVPLAQSRIICECVKQRAIFKAAKVRLLIEMVVLPYGFIPPYLYPEEKPSSQIVWDSVAEPSGATGAWDSLSPSPP